MNTKIGTLLVLIAPCVQAVQTEQAAQATPTLHTVEVKGHQAEQDNSSPAGKIVISKKRVAESGVQSVMEILRSEPAVTLSKDGRIGLLGLPGYTQILIDGQVARGIDPLSLDLINVERIEIIKSSTAETGPFGIAGTINIIRRKIERQALTQLRLGAVSSGGYLGENIAWSSNPVGTAAPFAYRLSLSANRRLTPNESRYTAQSGASGTLAPLFQGRRDGLSKFNTLLANSELVWTFGDNQKLSFSPDLGEISSNQDAFETRHWSNRGLSLSQQGDQPLVSYSLPLRWNTRLESGAHITLTANTNHQRLENDSARSENWSDLGAHWRTHSETHTTSNQFLNLDFSTEFDGGHEVRAGARWMRNQSDTTLQDLLDGAEDAVLSAMGTRDNSQMRSSQLFTQDDWRLPEGLAFNLGVAVERRRYVLNEALGLHQVQTTFWSPSWHMSKKLGGNSKRLLRVSLAQSYQAPEVEKLLLRPRINLLAPCDMQRSCVANTADAPDSTGNPDLLPERALAANLSYTHGFGKDSEITFEWFARDISDKIGSEITQQSVAWSTLPRFVISPVNLGKAHVRGINVEGRGTLQDQWPAGPDLELLGSVGFARSVLSSLPGPDNRLDEQSPWRAKLALNYTAKAWPLRWGVDANWLPGDWVRNNLTERVYQSHKWSANANTNWKISADLRLILNLELQPGERTRIDDYQFNADLLRRETIFSNYRRISVRLEIKL